MRQRQNWPFKTKKERKKANSFRFFCHSDFLITKENCGSIEWPHGERFAFEWSAGRYPNIQTPSNSQPAQSVSQLPLTFFSPLIRETVPVLFCSVCCFFLTILPVELLVKFSHVFRSGDQNTEQVDSLAVHRLVIPEICCFTQFSRRTKVKRNRPSSLSLISMKSPSNSMTTLETVKEPTSLIAPELIFTVKVVRLFQCYISKWFRSRPG